MTNNRDDKMIKKTQNYFKYEPKTIEYRDGRCFDFCDNNDTPFSEIIFQGLSFEYWHIWTEEYREYDNHINDCEWQYIEYAKVIEQTNEYTLMYTRLLSDDTEDGNFELDAECTIKITHDNLQSIKDKYNQEKNIFQDIQDVLIGRFDFNKADCNSCCCNCNDNPKKKYVCLIKDFSDETTIGEAKEIIDIANRYIKKSVNKLTDASAKKSLCFTKQGATGEIKLSYKIQ